MQEAKKAAFSIETYKITKINFLDPRTEDGSLSLTFAPSGKFYVKTSLFVMELTCIANFGEETPSLENRVIEATIEATFRFEENISFEEIPSYFYKNSLGIIFPYLRAFISTITFQANVDKPLILPLLNLTTLDEPFKEHTIVIED